MTEAEWMACTDPTPMLEFLKGKASDRKQRLFAVACCRRTWHLLTDERSRKAVETSERYADGKATDEELTKAVGDVWDEVDGEGFGLEDEAAAWAASDIEAAVSFVPEMAAWAGRTKDAAGESIAQCEVVRDIFGNPFRPVALDPAWRTPTVTALATAAYEEQHLPAGTLDADR